MAYDEALASRVRRVMMRELDAAEKRMFGGLCFTVSGKMCCGVLGPDLVLRVPPERYETALPAPHVRPMDFTGRPIRGFLYVGPKGTHDARALRKWIAEGIGFARSLVTAGGAARPGLGQSHRCAGAGIRDGVHYEEALGLGSFKPLTRDDLERRLKTGLLHYAYSRPHQALEGATPGRGLLRDQARAPVGYPAAQRQARRAFRRARTGHRPPRL